MKDYIKEYTDLSQQEKRQLLYKRRFKVDYPKWDDSMVLLRDLFDASTSNKINVLDIGCGNGNFVIDELSIKFKEKIGIDTNHAVPSKNICLDKIVYGNIENLPFEDKSFDSVIALWVLEHLQNPKIIFNEVHRVLKLDGIFAFVTPNKNSYLILFRKIIGGKVSTFLLKKLYVRQPKDTFQVVYNANTLSEIAGIASETGFKISYLKTNFDPSYTSFGYFSYLINTLMYRLKYGIFDAHIICILRK